MSVEESIAEDEGSVDRRGPLRLVLWRLHFFAGLLVAPIVLSLAVTGILFAWNPQIESALYSHALTAVAEGPPRPLSEQVEAAHRQHPGWTLRAVAPPAHDGATTGVTLTPPGAVSTASEPAPRTVTVYVDPASARVTGHIVETRRPSEWLRNLHSNWRIGPAAAPITELAASWVVVSLLTGLYLWWPRGRAWRRALRMPWRSRGRGRWRQAHTLVGAGTSVLLLVMVGTGLTWTNYAGGWVDALKTSLSAETPSVSRELDGPPGAANAGVDAVLNSARAAGLRAPLEIEPPGEPGRAWTASTIDDTWPIETTTVAVDPGTGRIVDRVDWDDHPLLAKATTLGIDFHQAQLFGTANQVLLTGLALALIVLIVAGYRMWWRRRPVGELGAPPGAGPLLRTVPVPLLIGFGLLMLLPLLGASFLIYLAVERLTRALRGADS